MGVFIKQNNELVNVGASCKVEVVTDTLALRLNQNQNYTYNSEDVVFLPMNAFHTDKKITEVNLPNAISDGGQYYIFYNCTSLTKVSLAKLAVAGASKFTSCSNLTDVNLPKLVTIDDNDFANCTSLQHISLPKVTMIKYNSFSGCSSLVDITLGANQVCYLFNTNAIPQKSPAVIIYVPTPTLVNSYKTATNWSTLYNNGYVDFQLIPV